MRFKMIALALFACLALGAFAASATQAAQWTVGAAENQTTAGETLSKEGINCYRHGTSNLILHGILLGSTVELSANQIGCVETSIDTKASDSEDHVEGFLTFTEVKVLQPSTKCSVGNVGKASSGEFTTEKLTESLGMDTKVAGSTAVFDRYFPEVIGGPLVRVEFGGAECPLNEASAPLTGTACGEWVHTNAAGTGYEESRTGTLTKINTLLFGKAQQETGACELKLANKEALLTGAIDKTMNGSLHALNVDRPWGPD